jgi:mRNA interferase YafQ
MRRVTTTSGYRKAFKKLSKSGKFPIDELETVLIQLRNREVLGEKYRDHELKGKFLGDRECHIRFDLLLVYRIENNDLVLVLVDLGTHPALFK